MKTRIHHTTALILLGVSISFTSQAKQTGWYVQPVLGFSSVSNQSMTASEADILNGDWQTDTDSGFVSGLYTGYRYDNNWHVDIGFEYRTNDAQTRVQNFADLDNRYEGNLASFVIYTNAYYQFYKTRTWRSYAGFGLGIIQEIDIDLESEETIAPEQSFSDSGDLLYQFSLGAEYWINESWSFDMSLRKAISGGIEFAGEENAVGLVGDLDYNPLTYSASMKISF